MAKLFILLIPLMIIFVGCNSKPFDEETVDKAKETARSYIENNYQDIDSIELEEPYQAPMGSLTMAGTVNGEYSFTISLDDHSTVLGMGTNEGFPERKEECKEESCDY